jgi:glyoxylase-like metal-dependent hydrolase (beta-lactamase superfamily II)
MTKSLSLPRRLGHVARMIGAFAGPPIERWSPRPPLPATASPVSYQLGHGITLWRLPVGVVRIRARHRALPADLAVVDDKLRFPVMMSDRRITGWLDCTAWLIDHPERRILIDTGESVEFGTPDYFGAAAKSMGKIYPKIIDATAASGNDLPAMVAATGHRLKDIDLCVLTHTHSDHVGNLADLPASTRLLVSPEELVPAARSGRLLPKLPQDGRVQQTVRDTTRDAFGPVMSLTESGDVFVVATPGHTAGHQSVVIDLGERRIVLAGDAAFDDDQVAQGTIPGIVEQRAATLSTYDLLNRVAQEKPTLTLFTHDPANPAKLATFVHCG